MARPCLRCGGSKLDRWGYPCTLCKSMATPSPSPTPTPPDPLKSLTPEEFAKCEGISKKELEEALHKGEEDRRKCEGVGMPSHIPNILFR